MAEGGAAIARIRLVWRIFGIGMLALAEIYAQAN
jgi:hypothetical protein